MAKADKQTVLKRTQEVHKLILAGAEFSDIRQYAAEHGWELSPRQLHRYLERAYDQFAESSRQHRGQLLGRHLMQRRALYARAIKTGDLRAALQILRDEAELQGLYTPPGEQPAKADEPTKFESALTRQERVVKRMNALARNDDAERRLVEQATPRYCYPLLDTQFPELMLNVIALRYINEQLEQAGTFLFATRSLALGEDPEPLSPTEVMALVSAYLFAVGQQGWELFIRKLGIDGEFLVNSNYSGTLLTLANTHLVPLAPTREMLESVWPQIAGAPLPDEILTPRHKAREWWRLFQEVCRDRRWQMPREWPETA